ncbi:MAG: peptide/nickel transport system substrate-binding protein [Solirubrobacterales bacterium]|nr:peptide/nickel transport system substrate-binding protein [Solirubrobacterales bacterium]
MKKFSIFLLIAALAAVSAVALAACGGGSSSSSPSSTSESESEGESTPPAEGEGSEGGTLKGAYTSFPDYMDPQISYTAEGWTAMRPVYVPLLTYKAAAEAEGSEIIPGLAKELPKVTNGGKTYTLFLRPGLKYSNGEPIKAGDFKYAVERCFLTNSGGSPFYTDIVGAEKFAETKKGGIPGIKVNEKTGEIVINLENPRGTFNNELALMFVAPIPQSTPSEDQSASPIPASGPYMITQSQPGRGWTYERNPYWAKDNGKEIELPAGHVDKIEIEVQRNQSTQINDVESGKLNWIFDPPPTDRYQEVKENFEGSQFTSEPTISTYYFWMNQTTEPFNNLKIREAVNYAVDPAALERIYTGQIVGTQQILPPGMPGYKKFELFPHDVAKAKELVAESGVKDKEVTVWTDSESPNNDAGTYYQGVLEEIGLKVELKILNPDNYFTVIGNTSTPNLDTGFADWFQDYPHPNDFLFLLNGENIQSTNNQVFGQTNVPALNKKIDKLATELLGPQQETEYAELDEEFMKEAAWAPYGTRTLSLFVSENINLETAIWNPTFETELTSLEFTE